MYTFFLDTNRINAKQGCIHMNELEQLAADGFCKLLMPKISWDEAEAGTDIKRKNKTRDYYYIEITHTEDQEYWYKVIENIVFQDGAKNKNEKNDIWILVTAREMNYPLVTNDGDSKSQRGGILGNRQRLKEIGVDVLRDYEAVALVKTEGNT